MDPLPHTLLHSLHSLIHSLCTWILFTAHCHSLSLCAWILFTTHCHTLSLCAWILFHHRFHILSPHQWYDGKIEAVVEPGVYAIKFDDGDREPAVRRYRIRRKYDERPAL
jgi:hypothetical protein